MYQSHYERGLIYEKSSFYIFSSYWFFSFFCVYCFFLTLSCDLQKFLWQDILILLLGSLFIYVFSRFIGWVVNVIIKS